MHSRNSGVDPNTPQAVAPVKWYTSPSDLTLTPQYAAETELAEVIAALHGGDEGHDEPSRVADDAGALLKLARQPAYSVPVADSGAPGHRTFPTG